MVNSTAIIVSFTFSVRLLCHSKWRASISKRWVCVCVRVFFFICVDCVSWRIKACRWKCLNIYVCMQHIYRYLFYGWSNSFNYCDCLHIISWANVLYTRQSVHFMFNMYLKCLFMYEYVWWCLFFSCEFNDPI